MRSRTIYQKTEGVAETKKWKITAMLVNVTKKSFSEENMMLVNQPSKWANTKEVRKKGGLKENNFFFFLLKPDPSRNGANCGVVWWWG